MVVNLVAEKDYKNEDNNCDLVGEAQHWAEILGVRVPYINILVRPGRNLANVIKNAAMNNRQRFFGFVAANELFKNLGIEGSEIKGKVVMEKYIWGI